MRVAPTDSAHHGSGRSAGRPFFVRALALLGLASWPLSPWAFALEGTRSVVLHATDGTRLVLGQVTFIARAEGPVGFSLKLDSKRFSDHFLSMREFKCLPGGTEILCHVPYPYPTPGTVAPGQWGWLEHSLLFFFKKPSEFGAKLWNGVYFQLQAQGDRLVGHPQAVDLNLIATPPARADQPPFRPTLREDMPAAARWFQRLTIE
jgi:hypothetical protein